VVNRAGTRKSRIENHECRYLDFEGSYMVYSTVSHRQSEGHTSGRRAIDTIITSSDSGSGLREWSVLSVWAIEELPAWLRGSVDQSNTRARAAIHRRPIMPNSS
jgi:hypothetical protein